MPNSLDNLTREELLDIAHELILYLKIQNIHERVARDIKARYAHFDEGEEVARTTAPLFVVQPRSGRRARQ